MKSSTVKKPAAKKAPATKSVARKPAAKKPVASKPAAKKSAAKKPAPSVKKPATKKPAAKKAATKKASVKKPAAGRSAAKKPVSGLMKGKKAAGVAKGKKPTVKKAAKTPVKKGAKASVKRAPKASVKKGAKAPGREAAREPAARGPSQEAIRRHFSRHVAGLLRTIPGVVSVEEVASDFSLKVTRHDQLEHSIFLGNFYHDTRELDPEQRDARLVGYFTEVLADKEEERWEEARELLLPALRPATFLRGHEFDEGARPLWREFLPFVSLFAVLDREQSMSFVTPADLERWGVTEAQVFEQALRNGAERLSPPVAYDSIHGPLFHVDVADSYESSRLALAGLLASFEGKVEGRPVAAVPERAQCWVGGDGRPEMIGRLGELAEREFQASNRSLSLALYTVDDGGAVVPLRLPPGHPQAGAVRLAHVKLAVQEYGLQKEALDALHEEQGVDVFVASLRGVTRDDGVSLTWCVWGEGVDSLLPEADLVFFVGAREGDPSFSVTFEALRRELGGSFKPDPAHHPRRYRVTRWPGAEQRKRLKKQATAIEEFSP